ncbi:MAG: RNA pseudouridine synthase [Xylophilus ampelinus]
MNEPVRLAKRLAEIRACSRREAEQLIEGGWVRVDGDVVDLPQERVGPQQRIEVDPQARPAPVAPVTLLLHKPPGFDAPEGRRPAAQLLTRAAHAPPPGAGGRTAPVLGRHLAQQACVTPLETGASGLVVFTQEWGVRRKLTEDAALVEHEVIVEVAGPVAPDALAQLNRAPVVDGRAMLPARVSVSRATPGTTGLRFATKGHWPGRIAQMCDAAGLRITGMKRIRIGRVALAGLAPGQWRYLLPHERI